ncbi:MAG TPA: hypothetical protein ENH91_14355 [Leeuwenhoekiella sp.]|nr:hypothetical protein [Leeuwenhoekiella sp.]
MFKLMATSLTRKLLFIGVLSYTLALGIGSLIHMPKIMEEAPQNSDKIMHATAYFFFCLFWFIYLFLSGIQKRSFNNTLAITVGWSLFFGMIIEISQLEFTTYRTGDFFDMLANSTGILIAVLVLLMTKSSLVRIKTKF